MRRKWQSHESFKDEEHGSLFVEQTNVDEWQWRCTCGPFEGSGFADTKQKAKWSAEWAYEKLAAIFAEQKANATEH
jgi:hypothetical protein